MNDLEKAQRYWRKAQFWAGVAFLFAVLSLVLQVIGIYLRYHR